MPNTVSVIAIVSAVFLLIIFLLLIMRRRDSKGVKEDGMKTIESSISRFSFLLEEEGKKVGKIEEDIRESEREVYSRLDKIREANLDVYKAVEDSIKRLTAEVNTSLLAIRNDSNERLERIKKVVDENLQSTLEKKINSSFERVSQSLESLYKSLGEMNRLATDVSELNKMFSNVKARGTWGEIEAAAILSDLLSEGQYSENFSPKKGVTVEFAVKLPGKGQEAVYLPIDSKFPTESYSRYLDALEEGDRETIDSERKVMRDIIKNEARKIRDKYIAPPLTTDFAVMFLPTESLYAEVVRMKGLVEEVQNSFRVIITGPANFSAFINSIQLGFKTLQIQKNTHEIWRLFKTIKDQFDRFSDDLEKSKNAIVAAENRIDDAFKRNKAIQGKLQKIEIPDDKLYIEGEKNEGET